MYKKYVKRILDFTLSLLALIILSPILIIVNILVRINLGSPVIFKQQRPGKDGKIFHMYKFRTMRDAVEVSTGRKLTDDERLKLIKEQGTDAVTSDAQRLTKLGRILRMRSIDELPELVNILIGQMSIVGPRPLVLYINMWVKLIKQSFKRRDAMSLALLAAAAVSSLCMEMMIKKMLWMVFYIALINVRKTDILDTTIDKNGGTLHV